MCSPVGAAGRTAAPAYVVSAEKCTIGAGLGGAVETMAERKSDANRCPLISSDILYLSVKVPGRSRAPGSWSRCGGGLLAAKCWVKRRRAAKTRLYSDIAQAKDGDHRFGPILSALLLRGAALTGATL